MIFPLGSDPSAARFATAHRHASRCRSSPPDRLRDVGTPVPASWAVGRSGSGDAVRAGPPIDDAVRWTCRINISYEPINAARSPASEIFTR